MIFDYNDDMIIKVFLLHKVAADTEEDRWIRKISRNVVKRSGVWSHFKIDRLNENVVKCDHCPKMLNYGTATSNLRRHLRISHNIILDKEYFNSVANQVSL